MGQFTYDNNSRTPRQEKTAAVSIREVIPARNSLPL